MAEVQAQGLSRGDAPYVLVKGMDMARCVHGHGAGGVDKRPCLVLSLVSCRQETQEVVSRRHACVSLEVPSLSQTPGDGWILLPPAHHPLTQIP